MRDRGAGWGTWGYGIRHSVWGSRDRITGKRSKDRDAGTDERG